MAKTGLLNKLSLLTVADWGNRQSLEMTEAFGDYTKGLEATLAALKEVHQSKDLDTLFRAEEVLVLRERELYGGQDPAVLPSLNAAVTDFAVIKSAVATVREPEAYQKAAATYHSKKKAHGVVSDGCHEAINSHVTRLGNRMAAVGVSVPEKNILRQRQANMRVAKELYVELQRKALGIDKLPQKSRKLMH